MINKIRKMKYNKYYDNFAQMILVKTKILRNLRFNCKNIILNLVD